MHRRPELLVWGGVVTGLEFCNSSPAPLASLGEFLGQLRRLGWHPADMRAVEQHILELLSSNSLPYQFETVAAQSETV